MMGSVYSMPSNVFDACAPILADPHFCKIVCLSLLRDLRTCASTGEDPTGRDQVRDTLVVLRMAHHATTTQSISCLQYLPELGLNLVLLGNLLLQHQLHMELEELAESELEPPSLLLVNAVSHHSEMLTLVVCYLGALLPRDGACTAASLACFKQTLELASKPVWDLGRSKIAAAAQSQEAGGMRHPSLVPTVAAAMRAYLKQATSRALGASAEAHVNLQKAVLDSWLLPLLQSCPEHMRNVYHEGLASILFNYAKFAKLDREELLRYVRLGMVALARSDALRAATQSDKSAPAVTSAVATEDERKTRDSGLDIDLASDDAAQRRLVAVYMAPPFARARRRYEKLFREIEEFRREEFGLGRAQAPLPRSRGVGTATTNMSLTPGRTAMTTTPGTGMGYAYGNVPRTAMSTGTPLGQWTGAGGTGLQVPGSAGGTGLGLGDWPPPR